jgi:mycofactocin precursor peptide peptidase
MILGQARWPEVAAVVEAGGEAGADRPVLVVPLGSTEQHGPHLPLSTDTAIAVTLAERLAHRRPNVVVAPALPYGSSGEHAGFSGTLSIGQAALEFVVVELVRSADAFGAVLIVSAHGGNAEPMGRAVDVLRAEGRRVAGWMPGPGLLPHAVADAHAGRGETSMMLALDPAAVDLDRAEAGDTRPLADLLPQLRTGGVGSVAPNGVLGDPAGASAAEGRRLLDALTDDLVAACDRLVAGSVAVGSRG